MDNPEETIDLPTWIVGAHGSVTLERCESLLCETVDLNDALDAVLQQDRVMECEQGAAIGALNCNS